MFLVLYIITYKSHGLAFGKAKAASGQLEAKAGAFRPSRAGTALV